MKLGFISLLAISFINSAHSATSEIKPTSKVEECRIVYPTKQSSLDTRNDYPIELLKAIIKVTSKEYGACELKAVGPINQKRAIQALLGKKLDVAWLPATSQNNEKLLPLKVPLRKGLLGWRLLLVNKDQSEEFSNINTLAQLKTLRTAFGASWQDLPVMQENFDKVILGTDYEQMFKMLHHGRFDFFSRGLHEVLDEIEYHKEKGYEFEVVEKVMLRYKAVDLFYVNPEDQILYERLRKGMNEIIINGEFNELFYSYYANHIEQANIKDKTIIELKNPNFPDDVEYRDPQLWFQLTDL